LASASSALLFSVLANAGFAGAEVVLPGDRVSVSLGLLDAGTPQDVVIAIRSGLNRQWLMPRTDVTCPACVEVTSAPRKLAAGAAAEVMLRVRPVGAPGPHRWGVAMHGGHEPPLRIDITGVIRGLSARPDRIAFGVCDLDATSERTVKLAWHGEGELESIQIAIDDDTVRAVAALHRREAVAICRVVLGGGRQRARCLGGRLHITATIRAPDGSRHLARVDVPVSGRVVDPLMPVRPSSVFLGSLRLGESAEARVEVCSRPSGGVSVRSDMPGLRASMGAGGAAIHIRYKAGPGVVGVQRGLVRLGFGEPWVERAQIPITVHVQGDRLP
jgi:hypothetical protein